MDQLDIMPQLQAHEGKAAQHKMKSMLAKKYAGRQAIDKAAKEFEQVYLSQMLSHIVKPSDMPKPYGAGHAEKMFHSLLVDAYAKEISDAGGIGIAEQISRELLTMQEIAQ